MGTKFSTLHVRKSDISTVADALKKLCHADGNVSSGQFRTFDNVFYISQPSNDWITILNDWFRCGGEVEELGEYLSKEINAPIFTLSYFDDDICNINIYKNGLEVTGHTWGDEWSKDYYGETVGDPNVIKETLFLEIGIEEINNILNMEDLEEVVAEWEKVLKNPIWIQSAWLERLDKEVQEKFVLYDFN